MSDDMREIRERALAMKKRIDREWQSYFDSLAAPPREDGEGDAETLEHAAKLLALTVRGHLGLHDEELREMTGNSNVAVLRHWMEAVFAALAGEGGTEAQHKIDRLRISLESLREHHDETVRRLRKTEQDRDDAYNLLVKAGWVPHWGLEHAEEVIDKLLFFNDTATTESADTLTAGSDNRDVEQVDCTEGSADEWNTPRIVEEKPGLNACHFQGRVMTPEEAIAILVRQRASIAAEERKPLVDAAEDALTVCASCAHERWYQRLWEAVRGEPWTGGPASEDSPIGLTQAEFDQCIADASAEARREVVEEIIEQMGYEDLDSGEVWVETTSTDLRALAASPEETT